MKTTLTLGGIALVLLLFRFLAKKVSKKIEESELQRAESEPYEPNNHKVVIEGDMHQECETKQSLFSEKQEEFFVPTDVEEDLVIEPILKTSGLPEDYNDIQNLTIYNHGTYRGTDGRFKSKKT